MYPHNMLENNICIFRFKFENDTYVRSISNRLSTVYMIHYIISICIELQLSNINVLKFFDDLFLQPFGGLVD